jgi:protocatechuate 3,4-dioxygenase alpha subunit
MDITTSQTIGPFSHEAWRWACDATVTVSSTAPMITVSGVVRDGDGLPVNDAMVEAWLPAGAAVEAGQPLPGFRRVASAEDGAFSLTLSRPADAQAGAPAAFVTVFARGLGKHQFTVIFLADDASLDTAAILCQVPAERRHTLLARPQGTGSYAWDIALQGADETVFFDYV